MIKAKILELLDKWLQEGKIPHIKKGMSQDLESMIYQTLAELEAQKSADRLAKQESSNEKNS